MNTALEALAEIFTIQKIMTLRSCKECFAKIYGSFVICVMQLATMRYRDLTIESQFTWAS